MNTQSTKEYRAKLVLANNTICSITGSDQRSVQETVQDLFLNQKTLSINMKAHALRFEESQSSPTQFIFHESYLNGEQPVGSLAEYEVPNPLSVKSITEHRLSAQRAA